MFEAVYHTVKLNVLSHVKATIQSVSTGLSAVAIPAKLSCAVQYVGDDTILE